MIILQNPCDKENSIARKYNHSMSTSSNVLQSIFIPLLYFISYTKLVLKGCNPYRITLLALWPSTSPSKIKNKLKQFEVNLTCQ